MTRLLHLRGLPGPIAFAAGLEDVAVLLKSVLVGWPELPAGSGPSHPPFLFVRRDARGLHVSRPQYRFASRPRTKVGAVCTLVVELVDAYVSHAMHFGSLHTAAAEFGGRVVLFPATHRVGKSTLMTRLAASGRRIFADDLLPIDMATAEAVATGCLPRLRMPLPSSVCPAFASFVKENAALEDARYSYVTPARPTVHGDRAPIGAIVLLERRENGPAELSKAPVEAALLKLLQQETRRSFDATKTLSRYHDLVAGAQSFRMVFSDIEDAVTCLDRAFAEWPYASAAKSAPRRRGRRKFMLNGSSDGEVISRSPGITSKVVGEAGFLVDARTNQIHQLNAMGLGIWQLLEAPIGLPDVISVFVGAFPGVSKKQIRDDLSGVLADLEKAGLVQARTRTH
jgi:hypothetical protein